MATTTTTNTNANVNGSWDFLRTRDFGVGVLMFLFTNVAGSLISVLIGEKLKDQNWTFVVIGVALALSFVLAAALALYAHIYAWMNRNNSDEEYLARIGERLAHHNTGTRILDDDLTFFINAMKQYKYFTPEARVHFKNQVHLLIGNAKKNRVHN
ncbi:hypothetical protein Ddc_09188 [Ditylenchus destructor]|nr:hypothetical protein Ddc_09188 [Ditylenchus destructor]